MGRCAGCGRSGVLTKILVHVSKCEDYAAAFAAGTVLADPASEFAAHRALTRSQDSAARRAAATGQRYESYKAAAAHAGEVHRDRWRPGGTIGSETPVSLASVQVFVGGIVHDVSTPKGAALAAIANLDL